MTVEAHPTVLSTRVALASGMVAAQAGCSPDAALRLMGKRAAASDRTVEDIAIAVVDRKTRFG